VARRDLIGTLRAAIAAAVMFLAGPILPVIGGLGMLLSPAPVLVYAAGESRMALRAALATVVAAGLIVVGGGPTTFGPAAAGIYLMTFGVATVVMAAMLERRQSFEMIVLVATVVILTAGAAALLATVGSPATLADAMRTDLLNGMARGQKFYKAIGMQSGVPSETRAAIVDGTLRLAPALAALSAATAALLNLGVVWRYTGRERRLGYVLFGDLARWSAPEWLIWALVVAGFGLLFIPGAQLRLIALNLFVVVAAVYFCQGLAIMSFYFKVLAMPALARGLIYFVTMVQPVLAALVCAVGVFDLWIDFRRLKPPSREARNLGDYL
jgi:uncharacterized protein YybS (DUF2232 family)